MDKIYGRIYPGGDAKTVERELKKIAPYCRWTEGTWETLGIAWNEIENTPRDIRKLQTALVNIYSIAGIEQ